MEKYRSSEDLEGKILKLDDMLCIAGIIHQVRRSFLNNLEECNNTIVFKRLGVNQKEKIMFCEKHYGYRPRSGDFPESENGDFAALTRVALALLKLSEQKGYKKCHGI